MYEFNIQEAIQEYIWNKYIYTKRTSYTKSLPNQIRAVTTTLNLKETPNKSPAPDHASTRLSNSILHRILLLVLLIGGHLLVLIPGATLSLGSGHHLIFTTGPILRWIKISEDHLLAGGVYLLRCRSCRGNKDRRVVGLSIGVFTWCSKDLVLRKVYIHQVLLLSKGWRWRGSSERITSTQIQDQYGLHGQRDPSPRFRMCSHQTKGDNATIWVLVSLPAVMPSPQLRVVRSNRYILHMRQVSHS